MKKLDNEYKFDSRLRARNLRQGIISKSDVEQYVEALPDLTEECELLGMDTDLDIESPESHENEADVTPSAPVLVSALESDKAISSE